MKCYECKFWDSQRKRVKDGEVAAFCRANPPRVFKIKDRLYTVFPASRPDEWCGCFEPAEANSEKYDTQ